MTKQWYFMKKLKLSLSALFLLLITTNQAFTSNNSSLDVYKQIKIKAHLENRITAIRTEKLIAASQLANLAAQKNVLEAQKEKAVDLKTTNEIDFQLAENANGQDVLNFIKQKNRDILKIYKTQVRKFNDNFVAKTLKTPQVIIIPLTQIEKLKAERNKLRSELVKLVSNPQETTNKENQSNRTTQVRAVASQIKKISERLQTAEKNKRPALSNLNVRPENNYRDDTL